MEKYLGGEELSIEEIKKGIKVGCLNMSFVFMFCGFFFKNKGVQILLDVVIDYLLVFIEVVDIRGIDLKIEEEVFVKFSDDGEFVGLVFKIMMDFFVG